MCAIPMGVYQNRLQSKNFKYLFTQLRILINSLHDSVFTKKKNMKTKMSHENTTLSQTNKNSKKYGTVQHFCKSL